MRKIIVAVVLLIAILWVLSLFDEPQTDLEVAPLPDFELPAFELPETEHARSRPVTPNTDPRGFGAQKFRFRPCKARV